ncbi:hypothetical protein [Actinomadura decatromicini]|uniref:hypothetical protein n=1 Tax=Actinomadura decatromicini TaxID=2604572 RepID=UPI001FEABBDE|nr:hypothetical protein [Actinomadura decatromicini]
MTGPGALPVFSHRATRPAVQTSGFGRGPRGSSTFSTGLKSRSFDFLTALPRAELSTACTRLIRAGDSGLVDFLRRFSPSASSFFTESARAAISRTMSSLGFSPSGSGRLISSISA